jgi:hypothetical protein
LTEAVYAFFALLTLASYSSLIWERATLMFSMSIFIFMSTSPPTAASARSRSVPMKMDGVDTSSSSKRLVILLISDTIFL